MPLSDSLSNSMASLPIDVREDDKTGGLVAGPVGIFTTGLFCSGFVVVCVGNGGGGSGAFVLVVCVGWIGAVGSPSPEYSLDRNAG